MERQLTGAYRFLLNHWAGSALLALTAGLIFRWIFIQTFTMSDGSMSPLILPGDKVVTVKYSALYSKKVPLPRGQLVVYSPPLDLENRSIKRIAARSGDTVEVRKNEIWVNQSLIKRMPENPESRLTPGWFLWNDLPPLVLPGPGDTLFLANAGPREFDFAANLLKQIHPGEKIVSQCLFFRDESPINPKIIRKLTSQIPNWDEKNDLSQQPWYTLIQIQHFLKIQFPDKKVTFQCALLKNGERVTELVLREPVYFVLGDNISHSFDSRFWGFVTHSAIHSKPLFIGWNIEPNSWIKINFSRILKWIK